MGLSVAAAELSSGAAGAAEGVEGGTGTTGSTTALPAFASLLDRFRLRLAEALAAWIEGKRREARAAGQAEMLELIDGVASLAVDGGKRLRPALVYHTYLACGGRAPETAMPLALSTELLHTYLLIHDDIMDHAEVRRGHPTAHVRFERLHRERGLHGDPAEFGRAVAILLGDLAYGWSVELALAVAAQSQRGAQIGRCFAEMCQEVIGGQYLEILVAQRREATEAELERVLRLKSGRYTAERPIQLGAVLAGAPAPVAGALRRYGSAVGEAFQLQDDLLGTFGDSGDIGKAIDSDLREGKYTFLVHHALECAEGAERAAIEAALGNPDLTEDGFGAAAAAIAGSGARDRVRAMIEARLEAAQDALAEIDARDLAGEGRTFLTGLIDYLRERRR
jgi:geranylgeranyl diphosphate synthase type I